MSTRLFVVKDKVESLIEAEKSLIKRAELRDIIQEAKHKSHEKDKSKAEIEQIRAKARTIVNECYECHHTEEVSNYIRDIEKRIVIFDKEVGTDDFYYRPEKVLFHVNQIIPLIESSYAKAVSLANRKTKDVTNELYRVEAIGIISALTGLFLFLGFSIVSLKRVSRLELEIRESERKMMQSEKMAALGQMVAGVAHELSNPLTAINGFSELLLNTASDDNVRGMAEKINKSGIRAANIVQDLLVFSKTPRLEKTRVNIKGMLVEALDLVEESLHAGKINASVNVADDIVVSLDKAQMERVLFNLIVNSIHAIMDSKKGDRILLRAYKEGNHLFIEVSDNGPGIPQQIVHRIFEPFFTTKRFEKGTGLGLSICYNIVRAHGGDISVKSVEGQGTTFIIELPYQKLQ
jgi:signal transduction histidine kinase